MTSRWTLLGVALAALAAADAASGQAVSFSSMMPRQEALNRVGLERAWFAAVPISENSERLLNVSIAEDLLFAHTSNGWLHAFEAETGGKRWSAELGRAVDASTGVAVNSTTVIAANGQDLVALDRETGRVLWRQTLETPATTAVVADEDMALVGERSGKVQAFYLKPKGDPRFRRQTGPPGGFAWAWQTKGVMTSRPVVTEYVSAFGGGDGKLMVTLNSPQKVLHRSQSLGAISASLGTFGTRTLLVPTESNFLYGIDLFTGDHLWAFPTGHPIRDQPLVSGNAVYAITTEGSIVALDGRTGESLWGPGAISIGAADILTIGARRIYVTTPLHQLEIINRADGSMVADARTISEQAGLNLSAFTLPVTNDLNDRIYLATPSGLIVCIREIGALQPTLVHPVQELPFGYIPERDRMKREAAEAAARAAAANGASPDQALLPPE